MNQKLLMRISDLDNLISDWKKGLYPESEIPQFEMKLRNLADKIIVLIPKDRFEAGMTKEQWESLGEELKIRK